MIEAERLDGPARNLLYALPLLQDRVSFTFVTFADASSPESDFERAIIERGFVVHRVRQGFRLDVRVLWRLRRLLGKMHPDVLQVHNTKSRLFAILATIGMRQAALSRAVFFFHGQTWTNWRRRIYNSMDRWLFRLSSHVAVVTPYQRQLLVDWGVDRSRIHLVQNAIPECPVRESPHNALPVLLCAGRFTREKGHGVLVDAVAKVARRRGPTFRLELYGEGPERASIEARARKSVPDGVIHFKGYQPDLGSAYSASDLFVLPSLSEGLPNVLLEAGMAGVPILATRVGGVPALFEDGVHARLVPPGDVGALAMGIEEFLGHCERFKVFAEAARRKVLQEHSPTAKAAQLLQIYDRVSTSNEI